MFLCNFLVTGRYVWWTNAVIVKKYDCNLSAVFYSGLTAKYFRPCLVFGCCSFLSVALRPNAGHGLHILEVFRSHTTVGNTPLDE